MKSIQPATREDAETIVSLVHGAWKDTIDPRSSGHRMTVDDVHAVFDDEGGGFLVSRDDHVVGCICYRPNGKTLELSKLAVLPEARKQGFSIMLVQAVEDYARQRNFKRILLAVSQYNLSVIPLYQKLGYTIQENEVYEHSHPGSSPPVVMTRKLQTRKDYRLRAATLDDAANIASLVRAAWRNTIDERSSGHRITPEAVTDILQRGGGFIMEEHFNYGETRPVGCVCYVPDEDTLDLMKLAVLNDTRGYGLAKRLVLALEEHAVREGFKKVLLAVSTYNLSVIPFYEKLGYSIDEDAVYKYPSASVPGPKVLVKSL
ncbi:GNAT family N-acetyltransferase [Deinococcus roseus]|uniref:N-acetyltransferase domain-containing protein n=1 Tax=Deinococcus roseus TaxID=392414 RepID=A0ABQ2D0C8_9DEIO|nr:GNAT family N-acetyltransferase [Deinococcus roseus]GGJ35098.1 hypothetical protein GCM10008938_21500 [Deinococcus roseus]